MRVRRIIIENFKCFSGVSIETAKIARLTGANNSSKSSLMVSLLGSIQTFHTTFRLVENSLI